MDAPSADRVWRGLLPAPVRFSAGYAPPSIVLTPSEHRCLPGAGQRRVREFAAGRWHAKRALAELGVQATELPRRDDGAPAWPDGVVGSLAHAWHGEQVFVIAVVARAGCVAALGVDLEPRGRIEARSWSTWLSRTALDRVLALPVAQRHDEVRALWCAKEAVAKAGDRRELREIEIEFDRGRGRFDAISHAGRVVHEGGWTCAATARFAAAAPPDWP